MSDVVRFEQVTRVHGTGRGQVTALNGVSLTVAPGELVAVMGPSGSGKSTLLTLAGGLDHPTSGRVVVDGEDLAVLGPRDLARLRRRAIGYVFQELNLLPQLTAAENVMLPLELDGVPHAEAVRDARRALEAVGMLSLEDRFPDDLSGGERQRTAIARAIVGPRRLLLADEPTGALDSLNGEAILRLLHDHCGRGGSAIVVTHDARHAAWADRVVFLRDGRVVDQAGPMPGPEVLLLDGGRA